MDAPAESPKSNPNDETKVHPRKQGETFLTNALEAKVEPPLVVGEQFGDYSIECLIGSGKAGFVYSATDLVTGQKCALKVLCRLSPQDLYRNKLGFRQMSTVFHPMLMRADRLEVIDEMTVFTMELIEGCTLYQFTQGLLKQPREQAYRQLLGLLYDYSVGLLAIHFANLVHRDIKPMNLMVRDDGRGVIIDYGLVASCDLDTDGYGLRSYIAGTPRYFSPEALWEQSYTPAGDVFSLGLVFLDCVNLISGREQWLQEGDFADWVREEREQVIADAVEGMDGGVPDHLRKLIGQMLHPVRSERISLMTLIKTAQSVDIPIPFPVTNILYGRRQEFRQCSDWVRAIFKGGTGRLHLFGETGVGKTRLISELESRFRHEHSWGQMFRVTCRQRESGEMQVLDQIADQIAQRYSRSDREQIELAPATVAILTSLFPQLRHVLREKMGTHAEAFQPEPRRVDAIDALCKLFQAMLAVGPVIIVVDDAHWADRGSHDILDGLQQEEMPHLGILTTSYRGHTLQRCPPSETITLGSLSTDAAMTLLQKSVAKHGAQVKQQTLRELVKLSDGNAFRLQEIATEFRVGGILHSLEEVDESQLADVSDPDRYWRKRFDQLTDSAKRLLCCVFTAGKPALVAQLSKLSGLGQQIDRPLFDLVSSRLVLENGTRLDSLVVMHSKVAESLAGVLDPQQVRQSHLAWAQLLMDGGSTYENAASIATHFYQADQSGDALPYAIMAAEHASRAFAMGEAGAWHVRVLQQVTGDARSKHLMAAADCFEQADMPEKAAEYLLMLAEESADYQKQIEYQTRAIQWLIRNGQIDRAMPMVAKQMELYGIQVAEEPVSVEAIAETFATFAESLAEISSDGMEVIYPQLGSLAVDSAPIAFDSHELTFCSYVSRSMSFMNSGLAITLALHGSQRAMAHDTSMVRLHFGGLSSIWASGLGGCGSPLSAKSRNYLVRMLSRLNPHVTGVLRGNMYSCLGYVATIKSEWRGVTEVIDEALVHFRNDDNPMSFEVSQARWLEIWARWNLGNWQQMQEVFHELLGDAKRRSDLLQLMLTTTGFCGNALLCQDDVESLLALHQECEALCGKTDNLELVDFFHWVQAVNLDLYQGQIASAAAKVHWMLSEIEEATVAGMPVIKLSALQLAVLTCLHLQQRAWGQRGEGLAVESPVFSDRSPLREADYVNSLLVQLAELGDFGECLAAFYRGIFACQVGSMAAAREHFLEAAELSDQGELLPFQLAAADWLAYLDDPYATTESLQRLMRAEGIQCPDKLQRLFTVAPPRRS